MKKRLILLFLAIFLVPDFVSATEAYDFMSSVINSFQSSQIANERIKGGDSTDIVSLMKDIIVFNSEMKIAADFIKPHLSSSNERIKKTANSFHTIYLLIIQNNENLLNSIEKAFNNIEDTVLKKGTFSRQLSESMATNEELWRNLFYATAMSTYTMIDQKRTEKGKLKFLTITSKEKNLLIEQLINLFGEGIKNGPKDGQLPLKGSAALIYFFFNQGWRPSDSK